MHKSSISYKNILLIAVVVAIYSLSGLFTKLASSYDFLTTGYSLCLSGVICILGLYAILWQLVLKRIPLNQAYPFRSLSVVFGLAIAYFAFQETVTRQNLLGCAIVLLGLLIITTGR